MTSLGEHAYVDNQPVDMLLSTPPGATTGDPPHLQAMHARNSIRFHIINRKDIAGPSGPALRGLPRGPTMKSDLHIPGANVSAVRPGPTALFNHPGAQSLAQRAPYGASSRVLSALWRSTFIRNKLLHRRIAPLLRALPLVAPQADPVNATIEHLQCNMARHWRLRSLSDLSDRRFRHWVEFEGTDILERARVAGKGVIVANSHYGAVRCIPLSLIRYGYELVSLEAANILEKVGSNHADKLRVIIVGVNEKFLLRQTFLAREALKNGHILHTVADGLQGGSRVEVGFCGHRWKFATSFAQLALMTGAAVIPVLARLQSDGRITIHFHPPLDTGRAEQTNDERVHSLVSQYARFLESRWQQNPGAIRTPHLEHFLALARGATD